MDFSGFSRGVTYTPVPNPLFGPLLEEIQDLAELKVTLRGLWLLNRKRGMPRVVPLEQFLNDRALLKGLGSAGRDPQEEIRRGLELAVSRRTFLVYQPDPDPTGRRYYLLNTESDRRALARMQGDDNWSPGADPAFSEDHLDQPAPERPNIFALYEDNVGLISPMIAEELKEAEELYPWPWLNEAFKIAVTQNRRNWRYIAAILQRWAAEGKDSEGKDYGKPGGHSQKDSRQKYLEEYQRRRGHLPWEQGEREERRERG